MNKKNNSGLKIFLFLILTGTLIAPFISSCGKSAGANAVALNIQYQVINLSPDAGPVALYIDYRQYNNLNFYYPSPSGYFYLSSIVTPFQIRYSPIQVGATTVTQTGNIFVRNDTLKPNLKYTWFITGLRADSSLAEVFLTDTASLPHIGLGRIRFINLSPQSGAFDISANGTPAFTKQQYLKVSPFINLPAGMYTFQVYATGIPTDVIGSRQNVTIQDGRLYTMYSYGIAGRTDTASFGMGVITNK